MTVAIPQTYLHGVVEVALCDGGDTPGGHVSNGGELGAQGREEGGEEGEELRL